MTTERPQQQTQQQASTADANGSLSSLPDDDTPHKVTIIGSGNWGSAAAMIVGNNVQKSSKFHNTVTMWVYQEQINGRNLTDIINEQHENVKYLPNKKLPTNVIAEQIGRAHV